jgi:hypothetical protein
MQQELLNAHGPFTSVEDAQAAVDAWRKQYNTDRPHQSLAMAYPTAGSPPPPVTRSACGYPPSWPGVQRLPSLIPIPCRTTWGLPTQRNTLTATGQKAGPWNWTG